jgi:endonuclease/exonuclease/phosphatase family metal-dependent hydrolase
MLDSTDAIRMESMKQLETGSFARAREESFPPQSIRIITWNINCGQQLRQVIEFLSEFSADLILLQEADLNARRTRYRNIAREIAQALQMNYVFGCEFEELSQGKGGQHAYHGQATLSRFPLSNPRILAFNCQSQFWRPRWFIPRAGPFQRRLGGRMALISCVDLTDLKLIAYNVHLESKGSDDLRCSQLQEILASVSNCAPGSQTVVAGDFNLDLHHGNAAAKICKAGFSNPFVQLSGIPTTVPAHLRRSKTIDWILTKGPLAALEPKLHDSVQGSDHYPLSLTLRRL